MTADADALGQVHVRAWQRAYRGGLMPDDYLDALSADERAEMWANALGRPPRPHRAHLVAVDNAGEVAGFVLAGPTQEDAGIGEIYAINVEPDRWGEGAGKALLDAATQEMAAQGFSEVVLWVHPSNERARAFYARAGWTADGADRAQQVLGVTVPDVRYRRRVSLSQPLPVSARITSSGSARRCARSCRSPSQPGDNAP